MDLFLDTHIVCWLYFGEFARLSSSAKSLLETEALKISPIVKLELQFLNEVEKIDADPSRIVTYLQKKLDLSIGDEPFSDVIEKSIRETWTRDPFDRIIVAHAKVGRGRLLTKDRNIRANFREAVS